MFGHFFFIIIEKKNLRMFTIFLMRKMWSKKLHTGWNFFSSTLIIVHPIMAPGGKRVQCSPLNSLGNRILWVCLVSLLFYYFLLTLLFFYDAYMERIIIFNYASNFCLKSWSQTTHFQCTIYTLNAQKLVQINFR